PSSPRHLRSQSRQSSPVREKSSSLDHLEYAFSRTRAEICQKDRKILAAQVQKLRQRINNSSCKMMLTSIPARTWSPNIQTV
uniref:Uncharacterized protein n=1 Tax=Oryza brachyantha TaxID=4533 RepID=J3N658_ORYBR